jgi:hypothetical protein
MEPPVEDGRRPAAILAHDTAGGVERSDFTLAALVEGS